MVSTNDITELPPQPGFGGQSVHGVPILYACPILIDPKDKEDRRLQLLILTMLQLLDPNEKYSDCCMYLR